MKGEFVISSFVQKGVATVQIRKDDISKTVNGKSRNNLPVYLMLKAISKIYAEKINRKTGFFISVKVHLINVIKLFKEFYKKYIYFPFKDSDQLILTSKSANELNKNLRGINE